MIYFDDDSAISDDLEFNNSKRVIEAPIYDIYVSNSSRYNRQLESVDKWRTSNGRGTLNLIMRFGKTNVARMIYDRCLNRNKDLKCIVIVPNDITKRNILAVFPNTDNIKVYTIFQYNNVIKQTEELFCDLLILDEVHKFLNDEIVNKILKIKAYFILGLTGSKLTSEDIIFLNKLSIPVIDSISEIEAVEKGWISNSQEYNIPVELSDSDKARYAEYTTRIQETLSMFRNCHTYVNNKLNKAMFDSSFSLIMSCFIGKALKNGDFIKPTILRNIVADCAGWSKDMVIKNKYDADINRLWNPDNLYERCKNFKDYVKQRNDILINNRSKVDMVMEILRFNDVPTICFNESTEMVDILAEQYPKDGISYHSNIDSRFVWDKKTDDIIRTKDGRPKKIGKTSLKKIAIDGIRNGDYKYLFTAKSLNEGLTIENIEQVIITGGSTDVNTHDQRAARGKNLNINNITKKCIIINIYVNDFEIAGNTIFSRDKQKLIIRQSKSEITPIWVLSLNEIDL